MRPKYKVIIFHDNGTTTWRNEYYELSDAKISADIDKKFYGPHASVMVVECKYIA